MKKKRIRGFTLVELLVAIGIVALMMGLSVGIIGGSFHRQAKNEVARLIGAIRYSYNEAASKNLYYRIVFDFEKQRYWVESSEEPFLLTTDSEEQKDKKSKKEEEESEEAEGGFTAEEEGPIKSVKLDDSVKIKDVYMEHQEGLISEGQAYLYFFPRGQTEQAVINFSDEDEENFYSLVVEPLTAKCRAKAEYMSFTDLSTQ